MAANSEQTDVTGFARWADQLACPACLGALSLEKSRCVCAGCGCMYPIMDGIAVLISDRTESPTPSR